jgi:hypothetical protein
MSDEVEPTLDQLKAQLEKLHKNNTAMIQDLRKRKGIAPDPKILLQLRLEMLLDSVFEEAERYKFEIEFGKKLAEMLMVIDQQERGTTGLVLPNKAPLQLP